MYIRFSEEVQKILKNSRDEMINLKHSFIGSEHLVLSILKYNNIISNLLNDKGLTYDYFKKNIIEMIGYGNSDNNYYLYTPLMKRIIANTIIDIRENNDREISLINIFLSLLDEGEGIASRIIYSLNIDLDDLYLEISNKYNKKKNKKNHLLEYGEYLNDCVNKIDPVIGRDKEVSKLIEILGRRTKNNPLLIGEAGVGKTAIVEELARRIVEGRVPNNLINSKIISISMSSLVAGTKYRGEFEEKFNKIIREVENSNTILFIDEIHTIVGAGGAEGAIDASNIIKPALARGKLHLIGATTTTEYKKSIEEDKALNRRFQTIMVKEPNNIETINILLKLKPIYEKYHNVKIEDELIKKIVYYSNKYITNRFNPDKSIDILDEVCSKANINNNKNIDIISKLNNELNDIKNNKHNYLINNNYDKAYILKNKEVIIENKLKKIINKKNKIYIVNINDIANTIKEKSNVPIFDINKEDINKLNKLDLYLKRNIIGQENAISELVKYTKRLRLGLFNSNKPFSFFLKGSTGTGKTLLVKEYAKYLNMPLIRLDMSEYKESHTISKIIGSPPGYIGYDDKNYVLEKVRNNPFSIILLDEIEKGCNDVINLFLQILDEGLINDSKGNPVNFKNTIIFMTSNLNCSKESIGFINDDLSNNLDFFSNEFINRIDKVINFNKIDLLSIKKIIELEINKQKKYYKDKGFNIKIDKNIKEKILEKCNYNIYGARKVNKVLTDILDDIVINKLFVGI